jgi:hypothetical protein
MAKVRGKGETDPAKRKRIRSAKEEKILKICMFPYFGGALAGSLYYYFRYHFGEYKPFESLVLTLILLVAAGYLSLWTTRLICKIFHIDG